MVKYKKIAIQDDSRETQEDSGEIEKNGFKSQRKTEVNFMEANRARKARGRQKDERRGKRNVTRKRYKPRSLS